MTLDSTDHISVCEKCGDDAGICDRCYEMDKTCRDTSHVLTRYVVYKGEKNISKQFTEKDCCQFCKEQLGGGVFYCKLCKTINVLSFSETNSGVM